MNLEQIQASLHGQLAGSAEEDAITNRVLLRTGIDLQAPAPQHLDEADAADTVRTALAELGYRV